METAKEDIILLPSMIKDVTGKNINLQLSIDNAERDNVMVMKFLIIIITFEHCVVILKFLIENYIPDIPQWVERSLYQVKEKKEKLEIKRAEKLQKEKLKSCEYLVSS
jgi:hypothetical protein